MCTESRQCFAFLRVPVSPCILPSVFFYKKKSILHLISFKTIIDIISYLFFFLTKCWKFYILEGLIIYGKNGIIRSIAIHVILKAQSV